MSFTAAVLLLISVITPAQKMGSLNKISIFPMPFEMKILVSLEAMFTISSEIPMINYAIKCRQREITFGFRPNIWEISINYAFIDDCIFAIRNLHFD